ncbi:hypothetical protein ACFV0Z_12785 [Streptomyces xiamenensis]|uniref:hypothetical protein n=1 Tax=Streptomyces xiamenensis TaxID=408015 RepID=UPI00369D4AF0
MNDVNDQIVSPGTYAFRFTCRAEGFAEIVFENQITIDRPMTMGEMSNGIRNTMARQSNLPALHVQNWTGNLRLERLR